MAERGDERHGSDIQGSDTVAENHEQLPVPPINVGPGREAENDIREPVDGGHEAGLSGRMGEEERQQRKGDLRDTTAENRDSLTAPKQEIVAIAPERRGLVRRRGGPCDLRHSASERTG